MQTQTNKRKSYELRDIILRQEKGTMVLESSISVERREYREIEII